MATSLAPRLRSAVGPYTAVEVRRFYAQGDWQDKVFYDILADHARVAPDRVFVTDGETSLTYGQLREQAVRLATGMAGLGIKRGDRVAVQMPNWPEFAVIAAAISRLGAVIVPIMPIFRLDEVRFALDHCSAVAIIGPQTFHNFDYRAMYAEIRVDRPDLQVVVLRPDDEAALDGEQVFATMMAEGDVDELDAALGETASPDDSFLIVYTSGTTARPKGCHHTFNTIYASSINMIRRLRVSEEDVFFNPSPITHSTGLVTGLLMPLIVGASSHFMPAWNPADGLRRIAEFKCTLTYTATTFLATLMQAYDPAQHDMSSMRYWVCAGAPIPGAVVSRAREMFAGVNVLSLYGRSENMTTTMCGPLDSAERSIASDGRGLEGYQIAVVDRDGNEVARGQEGDIAYRGPSHMLEYYLDPEQTAELYTPGGLSKSGDLGYMDNDGYVRVSGRVKDIIIRGGLNISSREVEDLLIAHEAIKDVAVVAMPDGRLGEKCCAYIVLMPGAPQLSLEDIAEHLRSKQVAVQKFPERLEIIDALPMTAVGKVRKNVLRDDIAAKLKAESAV